MSAGDSTGFATWSPSCRESPCPVSAWETDVLPVRVPGYRPDMLDELCAGGELVWIGAGPGRAALYLRGEVALLHTPGEPSEHPIAAALRARGPMFFADLAGAVGEPDRTVLTELWSLAWAACGHQRLLAPPARGRGAAGAAAAARGGAGPGGPAGTPTSSLPAARGRWSLVESLVRGRAGAGRAGARAGRDAA